MSQLTVKMQNGCVAIVDGSEDEIVNVINKMMAENRIEQTIKDQVKSETVNKRKPRNDIGIPRGKMMPFIPVNLTEDEILNNLKNEPEEPMKINKYLQCIGFHRYSSGTFGSEASRVLYRLEKVGVKFVRNNRNRKAICRDEQLKSLTFMIFKK